MTAGTISRTLILALAALAAVLVSYQPVAANAQRHKAAPFSGHFKGSIILSIQGSTAVSTITASGHTSTLGRSVMHATASGPAVLFGCTKVTGTGHVKGRKNNQVTYSFQTQFCLGAAHDNGTFTLTKGRGSMAGVHGSGSFVMSPSGLTNPIPVTLDLSGRYRL